MPPSFQFAFTIIGLMYPVRCAKAGTVLRTVRRGAVAGAFPPPSVRAWGARLTISGSNAPFPLTSVQVTVRLLADVAETELEIAFSNPGGIQREAEFILPLAKDEYRYELPLDFGVAPDSFQCSISFPKDQRPGFAADTGWSFGRHGSSGLTAALEKQAPPATSPSATAVGTS